LLITAVLYFLQQLCVTYLTCVLVELLCTSGVTVS